MEFIAKIRVTLLNTILDPQGKAVEQSLHSLGYQGVTETRIGKYIELKVSAENREQAEETVKQACFRMLSNPVMENYDYELIELGKNE